MSKRTYSFTLDTEGDRDILRWLERQDNRSAAIREAIRASVAGGVTLGDVYRAIKELERKVRAGIVVTSEEHTDASEDPTLAAALERLGA
jgi:hypothetical protein